MATYFPSFKMEEMRQSQLHMQHYRHAALQQAGTQAVLPSTPPIDH